MTCHWALLTTMPPCILHSSLLSLCLCFSRALSHILRVAYSRCIHFFLCIHWASCKVCSVLCYCAYSLYLPSPFFLSHYRDDLSLVVHAEVAALLHSSSVHRGPAGSNHQRSSHRGHTLYLHGAVPCDSCARLIAQSGFKEVCDSIHLPSFVTPFSLSPCGRSMYFCSSFFYTRTSIIHFPSEITVHRYPI
jgi:deoxycytidylate deaminase